MNKSEEEKLKAATLELKFEKLFERLENVAAMVGAKRKGVVSSSYVYTRKQIDNALQKAETLVRKLESDIDSWIEFSNISPAEIQIYIKYRRRYMNRLRKIRSGIDERPQTWSEIISKFFKKLEDAAKVTFPTAAKLVGMISKELAPPIAVKLLSYIK